MRKDTYLNVVLTVIAVLLSVDIWTRVAQNPIPGDTAMAQSRSRPNRQSGTQSPAPKGVSAIGNEAVGQRAKIIEELQKISEQFGGLRGLLESGTIKVQVSEGTDKERRNSASRR